jgi:5-(carboxyamino)imidazole ribonucleotide mutase
MSAPHVAVVMGSSTDYPTLAPAGRVLSELGVPFEVDVVSAHRTPKRMVEFAESAEARGLRVIIAGAGGAAHLPGMIAALTTVPVLGIPVCASALPGGMDALLSIVQMPRGVPVGTLAVGATGAHNAAILAAQILALTDPGLRERLHDLRRRMREAAIQQGVELAQMKEG